MTVKNRASVYSKKRTFQPKMIEEKGDFYLETPDEPSYQTWRIQNQSGEILRGVYYGDSKRSYVFLHRHENIEDVLSTSEHESIHSAIFQCIEWELDDIQAGTMLEKDSIIMDDNEEHAMIRIALQEVEYFGE